MWPRPWLDAVQHMEHHCPNDIANVRRRQACGPRWGSFQLLILPSSADIDVLASGECVVRLLLLPELLKLASYCPGCSMGGSVQIWRQRRIQSLWSFLIHLYSEVIAI